MTPNQFRRMLFLTWAYTRIARGKRKTSPENWRAYIRVDVGTWPAQQRRAEDIPLTLSLVLEEGLYVIMSYFLNTKAIGDICMIHINELPLTYLIIKLDGPIGPYISNSG